MNSRNDSAFNEIYNEIEQILISERKVETAILLKKIRSRHFSLKKYIGTLPKSLKPTRTEKGQQIGDRLFLKSNGFQIDGVTIAFNEKGYKIQQHGNFIESFEDASWLLWDLIEKIGIIGKAFIDETNKQTKHNREEQVKILSEF